MKNLLIVLTALTAQSLWAQSECKSIWVFKAVNSCVHRDNGPDLSSPLEDLGFKNESSGPLPGQRERGYNQQQVCRNVEEAYNRGNAGLGLRGTLVSETPVQEDRSKVNGEPRYTYYCKLNIKRHAYASAPNLACGVSDRPQMQNGGPAPQAAKDLTCFSCDHLRNPSAIVKCLRNTLEVIVPSKEIDIRDEDLAAVSKRIDFIRKSHNFTPIPELNNAEVQVLFQEHLEKHPVR